MASIKNEVTITPRARRSWRLDDLYHGQVLEVPAQMPPYGLRYILRTDGERHFGHFLDTGMMVEDYAIVGRLVGPEETIHIHVGQLR